MRFNLPVAATSLLVLSLYSTALAQDQKGDGKTLPEYHGPKKRIAVAPMDIPASTWTTYSSYYGSSSGFNSAEDVGQKLGTMMTTALQSTGRFRVLERQNIGDIKDEIKIGEDIGKNPSAVKKGNVLGAQVIVRCSVTEFQPHAKKQGGGISLGHVTIGGGGDESKVVVDVKIFDANTSEVLYSEKAEGSSKSGGGAVGFSVGSFSAAGGASKSDPAELATRHAIESAVYKICMKMQNIPWEIKIASVDGGSIFVACGTQDGIKVGDVFQVYKPGVAIKDPDTGESLGRAPDKLLGTVEVTDVAEKTCSVKYAGNEPLGVGYVLKLR